MNVLSLINNRIVVASVFVAGASLPFVFGRKADPARPENAPASDAAPPTRARSGTVAIDTGGGGGGSGGGEARVSPREELLSLLDRLHAAWNPWQREKILAEARDRAAFLSPPLLNLLQDHDAVPMVEAIDLAVALHLHEARPVLRTMALVGARDRVLALQGVERLEPWPAEELVGLLGDPDADVVLAALGLLQPRNELPFAAVVRLLGHPDTTVRDAAVAAVPRQPTADELEQLAAAYALLRGVETLDVLRAIGRTRLSPNLEGLLVRSLDDPDARVQRAVLDALAGKGSGLLQPQAVWYLVADAQVEPGIAAAAFRCLEQTGSYRDVPLRGQILFLSPLLQYCAARCLVLDRDRLGASLLLDLVEGGIEQFPELDQAEAERLVFSMRKLLARLSGTTPTTRADAWREWLSRTARLPPCQLDPMLLRQ